MTPPDSSSVPEGNNVDIFCLPGFQPLTAPIQEDHIQAHVDGTVDVVFYRDRPLTERTPRFYIAIGKEFGNQVVTYREFGNRHVTSERDPKRPVQNYRFLIRGNDVSILPGSYVLRFFADDQEVNVKYLLVTNSLIRSPCLPPSFRP